DWSSDVCSSDLSFTLLPALLGLLLTDRDRRRLPAWLPQRGLAPLTARPRVVLSVSAALAAGSLLLLPRAEFNSNPIHLRDPSSESVRALMELRSEEHTSELQSREN